MKALCFAALVLATAGLAQAQEPLAASLAVSEQHQHPRPGVKAMALAELEAAALENNPEIQLLTRRVAVLDSRVGAAGALEDPAFTYRGWGVPLREPWNVSQPQNMFMVSQTLPGGGKRALRAQVASQGTDVARAELEAKKREVSARVRVAFYALLRNEDELRLHDRHVALARQTFEAAKIKYTVGRVPQQDVLKAQVVLSRLVDHLFMAEEEGQLARAGLNTLLGRDPATPLEVFGEYVPAGPLPPLVELERIALENRAELRAASAVIQQGETKIKLAGKAYTPDFTFGAGYMLMPPGSRFRNTYMAEFSLNLPWLNRKKHDAEIAEARAEAGAIQAAYNLQRAVILQEVREALIRIETARKMVELYRDTLRPQAQMAMKAAAAAYQTDRTDFLNLLDSQNAAVDIEIAYFRSLADYEQRRADLERAIGAPLPGNADQTKEQTSKEVR